MKVVIETGGKQYLVSPGDKIKVEKIEKKVGDKLEMDKVLLYEDKQGKLHLGAPYLQDVIVECVVLDNGREEKKIIFKYKPKKRYRVKRGHRQPFTEVEITNVKESTKSQAPNIK